MRILSKIFRIHPLTAEDIMTEDTREKCELFRSYYFICFRSFDANPQSSTYLEPVSVFTVVTREGIISFHHRPTPHARNVLRRIHQLTDYVTISPDWINYALIDEITDGFAPLIGNLQMEVDSIDELVLILKESEQSDMLRRIGHARKKVMTSMRLLGSKADVVRGLIKRYDDRVGGEIGLYLGDIQDHLITMLQNVAHYEKIIARAHSNYLAQISIELTQSSNVTNDVMTKLTVLGTILVPMNVVTGLWGMNVEVPGKDVDGLAWFFGIIGGMTLLGIILYVYVRHNKVL
ncbi:cora-like Mg2+ transporter protein-domain-containing protein [Syncephalis fuscata]|nr:cora-like Mg2+ transporter protein-domain-containing protein [Syncephalis fuscata]